MILSVSRRTDVPAFYGEWFLNRLKEGFVCVRNPMNSRQISRVELTPGRVEAIVFWTKNPAESFLEKLNIYRRKGISVLFSVYTDALRGGYRAGTAAAVKRFERQPLFAAQKLPFAFEAARIPG